MNMQRKEFTFNLSQAPVEDTRNTNFLHTGLHSHRVQHVTQRQTLQNGSQQSTLLLPPSQNSKQHFDSEKEANKLNQNADRLKDLHSRLHQEAEKIRHWKVSTEIEIKQKDKKLSDAMQTIDTLRKSILELQFQNESVSTKLQEEKSMHQETLQKIVGTRDMCNALKEHMAKLEKSLMIGESERESLKCENQKRIEQFHDLVLKFQDLEIRGTAKDHEMKKTLQNQQAEHENDIKNAKLQISQAEEKIASLTSLKHEHEKNIQMMNEQLNVNTKQLTAAETEYNNLMEKLKEADEMINSKNLQLHFKEDSIANLEKNINHHKQKLEETETRLKGELQSLKEELSTEHSKTSSMQTQIQEKDNKLSELLQSIQLKEAQLQVMQEAVAKSETDNIHLEDEIKDLQQQLEKLKYELDKATACLEGFRRENKALSCQVESSNATIKDLQAKEATLSSDLQKVTQDKDNICSTLTCQLAELNVQIETLKKRIEQVSSEKQQKEIECIALQQDNEQKKTECNKLSVDIDKLMVTEKQLQNSISEEETCIKELNQKISDGEIKIHKLNNELSEAKMTIKKKEDSLKVYAEQEEARAKSLQEELADKDKKAENLGSRTKSLQAQLTAKTKQEKQAQQQLKSVRCQLAVQKRQNEKLTDDLSLSEAAKDQTANDLKVVQAASEQLKAEKEQLEELIKEIQSQVKLNVEELENARLDIETLRKEKEQLQRELEKVHAAADQCIKENNGLAGEIGIYKEETRLAQEDSKKAKEELEKATKSFDGQLNELCCTLEKYKLDNDKIVEEKDKELDALKAVLADRKEEELSAGKIQKKFTDLQVEYEALRVSMEVAENKIMLQDKELAEKRNEIATLQQKLVKMESEKALLKQKENRVPTAPATPKNSPANVRMGATPKTPQSNIRMAVTPKTPQTNIRMGGTPRTPQGILKTDEKPSTGRRVVFANLENSDSCDSPMEEAPSANVHTKPQAVSSTVKSSKLNIVKPNIRYSPKVTSVEPRTNPRQSAGTHLNRIGRGPAKSSEEQDELEKFKKLFPDAKSPEPSTQKFGKRGSKRESPGETKKTIFKSKVKKVMPKTKKGKNSDDLSWFDSDSIFGFCPEE